MIMRAAVCYCIVSLANACTTIHFDNGEYIEPNMVKEKWHHNIALDLYELSDPVNLKEQCGDGQWTSVKTELSFVNGLAATATNIYLPLWYPKTVQISCK